MVIDETVRALTLSRALALSAALGVATVLQACAPRDNIQVYFFTNPIYPTGLSPDVKSEMYKNEVVRQRIELEEAAEDYYRSGGQPGTGLHPVPIFTLRY